VGRQGREGADADEPWQLEGREGKITSVLLGGGARPPSLDLRSREEDGGGGVGKVGGGAQLGQRRRRREAAVFGLAESGEGGRRAAAGSGARAEVRSERKNASGRIPRDVEERRSSFGRRSC
jgi:hypothetical protein